MLDIASQWEKEEIKEGKENSKKKWRQHGEKLADGQEAFRKACRASSKGEEGKRQPEEAFRTHARFSASHLAAFLCRYSVGIPWWSRG